MIPQDHRGEGGGTPRMSEFPNRCQHLKVNGTQCGSPALRRNRFCFFHKRFQTERLSLHKSEVNQARARRRAATIHLPVLEDANSIQVSLMQIMRLLALGHLDLKTAGLLLYALQTASANLRRTNFEPNMHNIILDPRQVDETPLGGHIWDKEDFEDDEDDEEAQRGAAEAEARQRELERDAALWRGAMEERQRLTREEREQEERERIAREAGKRREAELAAMNQATLQAKSQALVPPQPANKPIESGARRPPRPVTVEEAREQVREIIGDALTPHG